MRIISGLFKGKKIIQPLDSNTRPLKDLTKESIFNIIKHSNKFQVNFEKSDILDLFSGVGSFGIECLSRGAKKVVFIENYRKVLPILRSNLQGLKSINNFEIFEKDTYELNTFLELKNTFDIIFLDPPYKDKKIDILFKNIRDSKILKKGGIVILHRHKKEENIMPLKFNIIEEKRYGISKILFFSNLN